MGVERTVRGGYNRLVCCLFDKQGFTTTRGKSTSKTRVVATTSKTPPRGTLLYQSDWSHGLARWPGSAGWKIIGEALQSNASSNTSLTVPYLPAVPNYAIEVRFQIVSIPHSGGYVVITADKTAGKDGYTAGIMGLLAPGPHSEFANPEVQVYMNPIDSMETNRIVSDYEPGSAWHTYRVEVQGPQVQFFIDDLRKSFATSAQTNFLSNGPIQVKTSSAIVNLLRVRITAL